VSRLTGFLQVNQEVIHLECVVPVSGLASSKQVELPIRGVEWPTTCLCSGSL